ncbi:MAG: glutathione S-transferase family protein [Thermohalobaculum sp.]|nr:glutathione S-transferase family protein [Thermohalobaculum sp.]
MILYGRDLSPYVRRVAIWCALQGRAVERRPLAATDPVESREIAKVHPGTRVPALVLDDGAVLIETSAICDWLDETAGARRLVPAAGLARRDCLQRIALATATAEKAVALVYEKNRRPEALHWADWQARVTGQVRGTLGALEAIAPETGFFGGAAPDGSDIAVVCAYQFAEATNPWLLDAGYPRLAALAERAMAIEAVAATKP